MDTVTYPDPATVQFVHDYLIAVRVQVGSEPTLASRFAIQYTPTLIMLDEECVERHRSVGFLRPQEFIASMLLGIGKSHYENNRLKKADQVLQKLLAEYPNSRWSEEAAGLRRAASKRAQ